MAGESLTIQSVCRQVQSVAPRRPVTVATGRERCSLIRRQLRSGGISPLSHADVNFRVVFRLLEVAERKGPANLVLMGIEPTYPSEKYGYNHGASSISLTRKRRALRSKLRLVPEVL